MSENTNIAWCDSTFNPWIGCQAISPGCANCYAAAWAKRYGRDFAARTLTKTWGDPVKWNKAPFYECSGCGWRGDRPPVERHAGISVASCAACNAAGRDHVLRLARRRVFCASLADVFDNEVDPLWRADLFALIQATPNLDWLLLTKRIGNVGNMLPVPFDFDRLYANVWLGATVVNQEEADRDIPKLLAVPAAKRFLSIEPMLAPISLRWLPAFPENAPHTAERPSGTTNHLDGLRRLDWIIAGGESGPGARPSHPDWYRALAGQCRAAGVPFFMKQMGGARDKRGAMDDLPEDLRVRGFPNGQ